MNRGLGRFDIGQELGVEVRELDSDVATGDFDGDGMLDLWIAGNPSSVWINRRR